MEFYYKKIKEKGVRTKRITRDTNKHVIVRAIRD